MFIELLLTLIFFSMLYLIYKLRQKPPETEATKAFGQVMAELGKLKTTIDDRTETQVKSQKQYQESMEKSISSFMNVISGTKRGSVGEKILKEILEMPIKTGLIVTDLNIGGTTVEFAWNLEDGKYIPIDAKLPEVDKLYEEYNKSKDIKEKKRIKNEIVSKIKNHVNEIKKYQNKQNTIDKCILGLPDGLIDIVPELNAEYQRHGIYIIGYSYVFFIAYYLHQAYKRMIETGDIGEYRLIIENLMNLMKDIKDKTVTIDRGVSMIDRANRDIEKSTIQSEAYKARKKMKKAIEEST